MEGYAPIFEIVIEDDVEDSGFIRNSLVQSPAVNVERLAFSEEEAEKLIFSKNEKEQIFTSVSILADTPIKRKTKDGQIFYVVFTKDVIRKIRNKMVKEGKTNELSLYHDDSEIIKDGVYMVENVILNKGRIESPLFKVPDGSLLTSYWVEDLNHYNELLNDEKFKGFSIEINARIQQIFSNSFESLYSKEIQRQQVNEILFSKELSEEQKRKKIQKVLNIIE